MPHPRYAVEEHAWNGAEYGEELRIRRLHFIELLVAFVVVTASLTSSQHLQRTAPFAKDNAADNTTHTDFERTLRVDMDLAVLRQRLEVVQHAVALDVDLLLHDIAA